MNEVEVWLESHGNLPKILRHRIKRYFRKHFTQKAVSADAIIINSLSPALVHDVGFFLIPEEIRGNAFFESLPISSLVELLSILERTECEAHDNIVLNGHQGTCMYIIIDGVAFLDRGKEKDPTAGTCAAQHGKQLLSKGGSFGEEIILGMEEKYLYHVTARTAVQMYSIGEAAFAQVFSSMPEVIEVATQNFMRNSSARTCNGPQTEAQSAPIVMLL